MPSYNYECQACNYQFETFHAMSAEPLTECPKCHKPKLIKLISPGASVIIRGTKTPCNGGRCCGTPQKRNKNKAEKPFWRDGSINKEVLKNPKKYIEKGEIN